MEFETSEDTMVAGLLHLANASQQPYVSELLSFTLDRLHKEPELLRVDAERIRRQMQEVAVGNYGVFIAAADALLSIREEVSAVDKHLESLITEIPKLTYGCTEFIDSAEQILEKRKSNRTLLANHSIVLDLLEIPQLMDTCVRNGNYDEALDLEAYVCKLSTMHPKLPVIQSLATEVRQTTQSLLSQLLQKLRSNIQLPECLRIIGYLRRIGVFSESEMRLQFLRCREAWLAGILDDLDQRNVYEYLKGMVNCHRMHLFDVVNQYRAIFADDTSGSEENYDGGLLFSWAMHQITSYLNTLKTLLPKITEGGSLSNILEQCMNMQDEMMDLMDVSNEIQESLRRSYSVPDDIDEDELLGELDALEADMGMKTKYEGVLAYLQPDKEPDLDAELNLPLAPSGHAAGPNRQNAQAWSPFVLAWKMVILIRVLLPEIPMI